MPHLRIAMIGGLLAGTATVALTLVASPASAAPTCDGRPATIVGTQGNDKIQGTRGPDVIVGLGGNDTIHGGGGADVICGGLGADRLYGGPGHDRLFSGANRPGVLTDKFDLLQGGPGDDLLVVPPRQGDGREVRLNYRDATGPVRVDLAAGSAAGRGNDTLVLRGQVGLVGSDFADVLLGSSRKDLIWGRKGDDVIRGRGSHDRIDAGRGNDRVWGGPGNDSISGDRGANILRGGPGNDSLSAGPHGGPDRLYGQGGNDQLEARVVTTPPLALSGGAGRDRASLGMDVPSPGLEITSDLGTGVTLFAGVDEPVLVDAEDLSVAPEGGVWTVTGSDGDDKIRVLGGRLVASMGDGDDRIGGWSLDDEIDGGPGHDVAIPRGGTDTCTSIEQTPAGDPCEVANP